MVPQLNNESVAHMGYTAYSPPPVGYLGARRHARAEERRVVGSRGRVVAHFIYALPWFPQPFFPNMPFVFVYNFPHLGNARPYALN